MCDMCMWSVGVLCVVLKDVVVCVVAGGIEV